MLQEADKIKARAHIAPEDVVKGNPRLNFAYVIIGDREREREREDSIASLCSG